MAEDEQFSIPSPNVIESSRGFSVQVLGRTGLLYREGDKALNVDSEVLLGPSGLVIYASSISSWAEPDQIAIPEEERARIVNNIERAFQFRGFHIQVS